MAGRIVVFGATGYTGALTARALVAQGARPVLAGRNRAALAALDCSGPRTDCTKIDQPLLRQLLREGQIRPDPLRLGIEVEPDGAVVGRNGKAAPDLFAIGPITKGTFWEIIAVPDIRVTCEQLAARLIPVPATQVTTRAS